MSEELAVEAIEILGEDVVATLGESTEEYTEGILEIQRSKSSAVSQDPSGRRRSSISRRRSSMSSSIFQGKFNSLDNKIFFCFDIEIFLLF